MRSSPGHDLLPAIEESELDEVMVEQGGAVAKRMTPSRSTTRVTVKPPGSSSSRTLAHRCAMLDVLAQPLQRSSSSLQHLFEDVVELAHVSLKIRGQRERGAGSRDAAAFADRGRRDRRSC